MNCGRKLGWRDMVPVFSYIILRGRCRQCGARISIQYPLIEETKVTCLCIVLGEDCYIPADRRSGCQCIQLKSLPLEVLNEVEKNKEEESLETG
jgi:hypothetical protein